MSVELSMAILKLMAGKLFEILFVGVIMML